LTYLLDANVISYFLHCRREVDLQPRDPRRLRRRFQSLPVSNSARGRGERASIALAAHDASRVLVANDRNAMWLALDELHLPGERIIGVPVFLRRLREQAALTVEAIDGVMGMRQGRRPTWWAAWRASLTSP